MKRHPLVLFLMGSLLAACGGGASNGSDVACAQRYWDGTVGTCLPPQWAVVDRPTLLSRGVPEEVVVGFQASTAVAGQFPTVAVTREILKQQLTPAAYSEASVRSVTVLPEYTLVDTRSVTLDGASVSLHVFTARPDAGQPARRFYQVSTVAGTMGYTFTGLTPQSIDAKLEQEVLLILGHVTFREPAEQEN